MPRQAALAGPAPRPVTLAAPAFVITEAEIARIAEVIGAAFDAVAVNR
jgi:hypothetical protein